MKMVYCGAFKKIGGINRLYVFVLNTPSPDWCRMRGHDLPLSFRAAKIRTIFETCK